MVVRLRRAHCVFVPSLHIAIVSTYPPRKCGLAEFTRDLRSAMIPTTPDWAIDICAIDRDGLNYDDCAVSVVIRHDNPHDYATAAGTIAKRGADLVVIQHEYGIFGGAQGDYVLTFADQLIAFGVPYVVTLHTVHSRPGARRVEVLRWLCRRAAVVTVFTTAARRIVAAAGIADEARTIVVPHGAPASLRSGVTTLTPGSALAHSLDQLDGARILATFGLIKPRKGLENVIKALPTVTQRHPGVCYVIAGATHPETRRLCGEDYRQRLVGMATKRHVSHHVRFVDAFLTEAEVATLLSRAEMAVTPYLSPDQASSGVLTFALVAGCPVVSSAYSYALEMLAPRDGLGAPGVIVPCGDVDALASAIDELLSDPVRLAGIRAAADRIGSQLTWPAVARQYAGVFAGGRRVETRSAPPRPSALPPLAS